MKPPPVLVRTGQLGDLVLLGAVTKALGRCAVATEPRWYSLVRHLTGVETVLHWRAAPQGCIDLQGSLRTRWALRGRCGGRIRKQTLRRRLWRRTGLQGLRRPTVPELYAEAVGVREAPLPWIAVPERPRNALGLAPGAAHGPKRWPTDRFAAVGRAWSGPVVVFGGPSEHALVSEVAAGVPGARIVVERGFTRTLDALASVRVMVAGDTGLLHLAGATGARCVGMFGPTHPDDGFWVYPGVALGNDVPCRPCALHRVQRCHTGHHGCLDVSPAQVVRAVEDLCAGSC